MEALDHTLSELNSQRLGIEEDLRCCRENLSYVDSALARGGSYLMALDLGLVPHPSHLEKIALKRESSEGNVFEFSELSIDLELEIKRKVAAIKMELQKHEKNFSKIFGKCLYIENLKNSKIINYCSEIVDFLISESVKLSKAKSCSYWDILERAALFDNIVYPGILKDGNQAMLEIRTLKLADELFEEALASLVQRVSLLLLFLIFFNILNKFLNNIFNNLIIFLIILIIFLIILIIFLII